MKSRLHTNNDNHSTTKFSFAISCKNVVKNHPVSNAAWVHNFQYNNTKLCEVIDLSLSLWKYNFYGVGLPDFKTGQVENRDKTGKTLNFPRLWSGIFTVCPWMVRTLAILPFWNKMISLTIELSQKTKNNNCFEQFFLHFLNFEPLPSLLFLA